jgi:hypothetical protein
MHEFREDQDDPDKQVSYFLLALKAAMMLERKKALQTPGDLVGIMIYNTVSLAYAVYLVPTAFFNELTLRLPSFNSHYR